MEQEIDVSKAPTSVREGFERRAKQLNLEIGKDIVLLCNSDGEWVHVITRNGYRSAVANEPDYHRHVVYPIYTGTRISIAGDTVSIDIPGDMGNIVGAIGFLYKKGMDGFFVWQVSLEDYSHLPGKLWNEMAGTMIVKVDEVGLIRMAYPKLFSGTYSDDEYWEGRKVNDAEGMVKYIHENCSYAMEEIGAHNKIDKHTPVDVLKGLCELIKTRKEVDESKAKHTEHQGTDEER